MTPPRNILSVRLDATLAKELERHCAQSGETRSHVVQQGVAQYLVARSGPTLGGLAEAVLPPTASEPGRKTRAPRQQRFRDYVRKKRRR